MVEVVPGLIHLFAPQREFEVGLRVRVLVKIHIHGNAVLRPIHGEQVEVALQRIVPCVELTCVGIRTVVPSLTPVTRAVEVAILRTGYDAILVSHLTDIYLTAFRPYYSALLCQHGCLIINGIIVAQNSSQIVAKHPERRPQTVGGVGETDSCFHAAVAYRNLILRIQSSRCTRAIATLIIHGGVPVILTLCVEN